MLNGKKTGMGVQAVIGVIRREDIAFMAASIAYHAFVSMLPVLLLLMLVVSAFGSDRFDATVVDMIRALFPATGQWVVVGALRNATGGIGLSLVGVGVLLWGTSKIFRAMDAAFAEIYDTERKLSLLDQLRDALVVVLALAVTAVGTVVLGSVIEVPATVPFAWVLNGLVAILGLTVAFSPIYYVFPNLDVSIRETLPGILVAATGWVGLKWLFNMYASLSTKPDVYGLVGTLVLLVMWLYIGGLVLLVGAAVNAALAGRDGARTAHQSEKRQFGRQITNAESLREHLAELISQANDADIPAEEIRRVLRRQAEAVGTPRDGQTAIDSEDEVGPNQANRVDR